MKNWLRNIKNFFRNIFWRNENETIIISDEFSIEDSFSKESMNNSEEEVKNLLENDLHSFSNEEKELAELWSDSENANTDNNFPLEIETIEIKEKVKNNSNDLLNTEEFPTLTHHKIELEKKPLPKKKHVIKKKKETTHLTPKQHKSKKLTIKLPKNMKNKSS